MEDSPYYSVKTSNGVFQARKHEYNGKTFVHQEMDADQFEEFGIMLIDADIMSVIQQTPQGDIDVNVGIIISHIMRKKMMRDFLVMVLRHEDGTAITKAELNGTASAFSALVWEVAESFFTMNTGLLTRMQGLLTQAIGASIAAGKILALALAGGNSSGPSLSTGQKRTP